MRKTASLLAFATIVLASMGPAARAGHCASSLVIFSYVNTGRGYVNYTNPNAAVCAADPYDEPPASLKRLGPAANEVSLRFTIYYVGVPQLNATIDGLGFRNDPVVLTEKDALGIGVWVYDSPRLAIPDGPLAQGPITATVTLPYTDANGSPVTQTVTFYTAFHTG